MEGWRRISIPANVLSFFSAAFQGVMAGGRSLHINVINLKPILQLSMRLQLCFFSVGTEEDNHCNETH